MPAIRTEAGSGDEYSYHELGKIHPVEHAGQVTNYSMDQSYMYISHPYAQFIQFMPHLHTAKSGMLFAHTTFVWRATMKLPHPLGNLKNI